MILQLWFYLYYMYVLILILVLFATYVLLQLCFHILSYARVTEWPPIGK